MHITHFYFGIKELQILYSSQFHSVITMSSARSKQSDADAIHAEIHEGFKEHFKVESNECYDSVNQRDLRETRHLTTPPEPRKRNGKLLLGLLLVLMVLLLLSGVLCGFVYFSVEISKIYTSSYSHAQQE